jgi:uncharacterized membrane protein
MEKSVRNEILKMLIPLIGTWWVISRILPSLANITWWDYGKNRIWVILGLVAYQAIWWGILKWVSIILAKNPIIL